jgi:hypothetical protein
MDSENIKLKSLTDRRFGSIILLFRLAGIPFRMKKISVIYAIYMRTVIICASSTYLGLFVDVYVHWNEFGRVMSTMRMLIPFTNIMWIYTYCRYVRTLTINVTATDVFVLKHSIAVTAMIISAEVYYREYKMPNEFFYSKYYVRVLGNVVSMLMR